MPIGHTTVIDKVRKTLVAMKKASTSEGADPERFKTAARCGAGGCESRCGDGQCRGTGDYQASVFMMKT